MKKAYVENDITFEDALKKLGVEDYSDRIFNSNSGGELFHLSHYVMMALYLKNTEWFRVLFVEIVEMAEKEWERPESIFQHIPKIMADCFIRN